MSATLRLCPAPGRGKRRDWERMADEAAIQMQLGQEPEGAECSCLFLSAGPKFYAERLLDHLARKKGYRLAKLRRTGSLPNPATGEVNHAYLAELQRMQ